MGDSSVDSRIGMVIGGSIPFDRDPPQMRSTADNSIADSRRQSNIDPPEARNAPETDSKGSAAADDSDWSVFEGANRFVTKSLTGNRVVGDLPRGPEVAAHSMVPQDITSDELFSILLDVLSTDQPSEEAARGTFRAYQEAKGGSTDNVASMTVDQLRDQVITMLSSNDTDASQTGSNSRPTGAVPERANFHRAGPFAQTAPAQFHQVGLARAELDLTMKLAHSSLEQAREMHRSLQMPNVSWIPGFGSLMKNFQDYMDEAFNEFELALVTQISLIQAELDNLQRSDSRS